MPSDLDRTHKYVIYPDSSSATEMNVIFIDFDAKGKQKNITFPPWIMELANKIIITSDFFKFSIFLDYEKLQCLVGSYNDVINNKRAFFIYVHSSTRYFKMPGSPQVLSIKETLPTKFSSPYLYSVWL